jgi:hypothetical protein
MQFTRYSFFFLVLVLAGYYGHAQSPDSLKRITGCICNETTIPLAYTHIINLSNGRGSISDTSGNFSLNVLISDSILFRNLAYQDLVVTGGEIQTGDTIHLKIRLYAIKEVKIFVWGSTYADFKAKMKSMPVTENFGEKLGLPQQKGNPIPNFRNPDVLSNPFFAYTNPVDFLYFNFNKKEQSIRKVMEFKQNEDLIRRFESIYNRGRIGILTGLAGEELDAFLIYLNIHFKCDFNCNEIQIISEIYMHCENYTNK